MQSFYLKLFAMQCYKNNFYAAKTSTFQIVKNVQISKNRVYYKIRIYNSGIINTYIKKNMILMLMLVNYGYNK